MKPLISVIVPVYNVEKYLNRCLDSILSQTLANLEVIAVNDGSTDNCGSILDDYAGKDRRLKVIHRENQGVSEARNEALRHVQGDFVSFVDSDDWLDKHMYEEMYRAAEDKRVDIVMCGYIREFDGHSRLKVMDLEDGSVIRGIEVHDSFVRKLIGPVRDEPFITENLDMHSVLWNKLYRTHLVKGLTFKSLKEIGSCEDLLFNLYAFNGADSITFINKPYYHYRKTSKDSVTHKYRQDLVLQRDKLTGHIREYIKCYNCSSRFNEALDNRICLGVLGLGLNIISGGNSSGFIKKSRQIREMLSNPQISVAFKNFSLAGFPWHWRLFYSFAGSRNAVCLYFMLKAIKVLIVVSR